MLKNFFQNWNFFFQRQRAVYHQKHSSNEDDSTNKSRSKTFSTETMLLQDISPSIQTTKIWSRLSEEITVIHESFH